MFNLQQLKNVLSNFQLNIQKIKSSPDYNQIKNTWYLVLGTRYQVLSIKYQVSITIKSGNIPQILFNILPQDIHSFASLFFVFLYIHHRSYFDQNQENNQLFELIWCNWFDPVARFLHWSMCESDRYFSIYRGFRKRTCRVDLRRK